MDGRGEREMETRDIFVLQLPPRPFVRPSLRAIFFHIMFDPLQIPVSEAIRVIHGYIADILMKGEKEYIARRRQMYIEVVSFFFNTHWQTLIFCIISAECIITRCLRTRSRSFMAVHC